MNQDQARRWAERVAELEREKEKVLQDRVALAMRVEELERVLSVARDALVAASDLYRTGLIYASDELIESVPRLRDEAISTIDAARSKEGQHHE